jgi:hypothetical protein
VTCSFWADIASGFYPAGDARPLDNADERNIRLSLRRGRKESPISGILLKGCQQDGDIPKSPFNDRQLLPPVGKQSQ